MVRPNRTFLRVLLFTAASFGYGRSYGQSERVSLSGTIRDGKSGEELLGATIRISTEPLQGAVANEYGFYSLTVAPGTYKVMVSFVGYTSFDSTVVLRGDTRLDVRMQPGVELKEFTVVKDRVKRDLAKPEMGVERMEMGTLERIPVILGERDVIKALQTLPGVKSGGDGSAGFFVRGGSADQNLVQLDEAPVYNPSHLLGFFSTFNTNAIKDVQLYKGSIPAEFGGRLSSVLDIKMKEGNEREFGGKASIGLISSNLMLEGPLKRDRSSFLIAGRRTYADLFLKLPSDTALRQNKLYFYDLNAKVNYKLGEKDRLYLSGYFGRDLLGFGNTFGIDWGNLTGTLRWNHVYGSKWFSNTSLIYSDYDYGVKIKNGASDVSVTSSIRDVNLSYELSYYQKPGSQFRFGFNSIHHTITPGRVSPVNDGTVVPQDRYGWENAVFGSWEKTVSDRLTIYLGLRGSSWSVLGKGDFYTFDSEGNTLDTLRYGAGTFVKTYVNAEPRASLSYQLSKNTSLKGAYVRTTQNLHLLSNNTAGNPTDRWMPNSNNVRPEIGDQVSAGVFRDIAYGEEVVEVSIESYYKWMQNQIDYRDGANLLVNEAVEGELLFGKGRAYGVELLVRKRTGRFFGWLSYTWSRTERSIQAIEDGRWYPARQDRIHDVSIVGMYDLNERWNFSALWTYNTGAPITIPSGKYIVDEQVFTAYSERNGGRMPAYHRLDLSATLKKRKEAKYAGSWVFSVFNAYGRMNPYSIRFEVDEKDPTRTNAVQTSLFRWVPSVSYNINF